MVKSASLFSQLLEQIPRLDFGELVFKHRAEYNSKGFSCWRQFVAMLFCHLARADSLREICNGLAACTGKLVHLGIGAAPNKSSLSYANLHRPAALYEDLFWRLMDRFRRQRLLGDRPTRFRFKNKLLTLDATVVTLCLSLFPWASYRRAKGGVKLHVLLDNDDYLPAYVLVTEARKHDLHAARALRLPAGSIVAMDRAYNDFELFRTWTRQGVYFVTRMKENTRFEVLENREPPLNSYIFLDQIIRLTGQTAGDDLLLRRVVVWDPEKKREIVLLTNHLKFGATTIAMIYRERWQIEVFFKALKQNLRIKSFVGTSENALLIQIWTALIAMLLLKWLHHLSQAGLSLCGLAALLRMNLFTYRDLMEWLKEPFRTPPQEPGPVQLSLSFA